MKIYLDIDGTMMHEDIEQIGKPAEGLAEFITALRPYDVYWLTTHCKDGNPIRASEIGVSHRFALVRHMSHEVCFTRHERFWGQYSPVGQVANFCYQREVSAREVWGCVHSRYLVFKHLAQSKSTDATAHVGVSGVGDGANG